MSDRPYIIGIDPGFSGAVAVLDTTDTRLVTVEDIPIYSKASKARKSGTMTYVDVHKLAMIVDRYAKQTSIAVIEEVGAMPKQGLSSTFRFGYTAGQCHGVCAANYIPTFPVRPGVWKPALGVSGDKTRSINLAREKLKSSKQYIRFKKHHDRAEAALMAYYGMRVILPML